MVVRFDPVEVQLFIGCDGAREASALRISMYARNHEMGWMLMCLCGCVRIFKRHYSNLINCREQKNRMRWMDVHIGW